MDDASSMVEPYSKTSSEELSSLFESELSEETELSLTEAYENLKNENSKKAVRKC